MQAGCELVAPGSWAQAPRTTVVVGLRALPAHHTPLVHRHVYFGHAFKGQSGSRELLARFARGGGRLIDLEYLTDRHRARLVTFGHAAGRMGVAAGVLAWCRQVMARPTIGISIPPDLIAKLDTLPLVDHIKALLQTAVAFNNNARPRVAVIGFGIVGQDAVQFAETLGLEVDVWRRERTAYDELLQKDVLVNAIKLDARAPPKPFLTRSQLSKAGAARRLSVVVDIACDTTNPHNPLPIYERTTTFQEPTVRIIEAKLPDALPLDVIAIPTLTQLIALSASEEFSAKFAPLLRDQLAPWLDGQLRAGDDNAFQRADDIFRAHLSPLLPVPLERAGRKFLGVSRVQQRVQQLVAGEAASASDNNTAVFGYNVCDAFELPAAAQQRLAGQSDARIVELLTAAVGAVARSHEMLRAAVEPRGIQLLAEHKAAARSAPTANEADFQSRASALVCEALAPQSGRAWSFDVLRVADSGAFRLLIVAHRLVADEASLALVAAEIAHALSTDAVAPAAAAAAAPALDFVDVVSASWWGATAGEPLPRQRAALRDEDESVLSAPPEEREARRRAATDAALAHWRDRLKHSPPVVQLPLDRTRPAYATFVAASAQLSLDAELVDRLCALEMPTSGAPNALAERQMRLSCIVLAAYAALLVRLTGESDLVLGTLFSGRDRPGALGVVGPLADLLVLRVALDRERHTFADVLRIATLEYQSAIAHQDMPFATLLDAVDAAAAASGAEHAPLFSLLFLLTSQLGGVPPASASDAAPAPLTRAALATRCQAHDVALLVDDCAAPGRPLALELRYNARLFAAPRMLEFLSQMRLLLTQVADNAELHFEQYDLITETARQVLPNPTVDSLDATWRGSVPSYLSKHAGDPQRASRIAVSYMKQSLTYAELDDLTNRVANRLIADGIQRNDVVAIYGHRSPAVVVAILGIMKAGAAYSMIDPQYPTERIAACLQIATPRGWLAIEAAGREPADLLAVLDAHGFEARLTLPAAMHAFLARDSAAPPPADRAFKPNDVAVVTFTSGSTGQPKGVRGRHLALTHFYPWMSERFDIGESDRFAMCSGIAHDPLQRDIFTPVFFGASVHVPTQDDIVEPGRLAEWMLRESITVACLTPALGQLLVTVDRPTFTLPDLRVVFFVGDMLIKRDVQRLRRLAPSCVCVNMLGSTETQRAVSFMAVEPSDDMSTFKEVVPAGVGMKDVELIILNARGKQCGVSEVGEIFFRSPHLAKDYVGLPAETAQRFIVNPFRTGADAAAALRDGDRFYKTGDLGRYMHDGCVECLGRGDDQVKVRGFRIELGEINAHLSQHARVRTNVTVVWQDPTGDKKIVSYVVPTSLPDGARDMSANDLAQSMRAFVKERLPHYMVPSYVVLLETMPLTPNGKINRAALPPPRTSLAAGDDDGDAPARTSTDTENKLSHIWTALLDVERVQLDDDFFSLGGHSVLATRLVLQANKAFGIKLPMTALLGNPTVAGMARAIDRVLAGAVDSAHADAALAPAAVDLASECVLPDDVRVAVGASAAAAAAEGDGDILLTGASGFLGAFLLATLLERTRERTVLCHVRAPTAQAGRQRLERSLRAHLLWRDEYAARFDALPGDLAKPALGLSDSSIDRVARTVSLIVHNGATVHWLLPYAALKPANVGGTIEVLRLACRGRTKRVCYVSTTSVFDDAAHRVAARIAEDDALASAAGLSGGYPQSKWVADRLVSMAAARGLSVCVVRPGYVAGDAERGVWNVDDFLCRLLKGCVQLGAAPALADDAVLDLTPVNVVADIVVAAALSDSTRNLNVVNPQRFRFAALFQGLRDFGYSAESLPYNVWRQRLLDSVEKHDGAAPAQENALAPLLSVLTATWADDLVVGSSRVYDNERLLQVCKGAATAFPDMVAVLPTYFSYFVRCKFVDAPKASPSNINIDWALIANGVEQLTRSSRAQQ